MASRLEDITQRLLKAKILLSAQTTACCFYQSLGFKTVGQPYDDCGIEHMAIFYHP
jgi:predicted GNAT family N-acyltransferase